MTKKKAKCIPVKDVVLWSLAGYAVYLAALYVFRKPACDYTQKLCQQLQQLNQELPQ